MDIVGVSFDAPAKNKEWATDEGFQYELWSDLERTLAVTYGAASSTSALTALRITVVLDADSNLRLQYLEDINLGTHPSEVLEDCQKMFAP